MNDKIRNTLYGDVTIHLVEKIVASCSSFDQAGSTTCKRKRSSRKAEKAEMKYGLCLGKIKVESGRLRRCSQFFETGLSERWTQRKRTPLEMDFYLEAQTDMVYYKDCFSRMHYLFKPIPSIAYCIELLKVASQILFQDLLSLGVKYLAASVWSISEEKQIHEFYEAGHLPFVTASDLRARLLGEQPLTEEDQKNKLSQCSQEMLSGYLRHAIPNDSTPGPKSWREALCSCPDSSIKFAGALHTVMSGTCNDDVLQFALTLIKEETEQLLGSITNLLHDDDDGTGSESVQRDMHNLCWLFKVSRRATAAQGILEALVKATPLSCEMKDTVKYIPIPDGRYPDDMLKKWAQVVIGPIFQDVLEGRMFLDTPQRISLVNDWCWILRFLDRDEERVGEFVTRFLMTLPELEQEKFWMSALLDPVCGRSFTEAHKSWIKRLVSEVAAGSDRIKLVIPGSDLLCEFPY